MNGSEKPDFSQALTVARKLDLNLPDSRAVRDAYAQAREESVPWLFNHVARSWFYGAKLAQHRALTPDAELVAVAVLLHDLGLARGGAPDRRFEIVGADLGRAFALAQDMGERRAEAIWDAIALHTTASIAQHKSADVACCQSGIACDYGGVGYQQLSDDHKKAILSAYPRLDMKNMLTTCLCGIATNHPNTTRDNFIADFGLKYVPGYTRPSAVDFLHQAPFTEQAIDSAPGDLYWMCQGRRPRLRQRLLVLHADDGFHALIDELMRHATQKKYEYRHRWRHGDWVLWDNRSVMHQANPDYDMAQRRYLYRLMLKGETPV